MEVQLNKSILTIAAAALALVGCGQGAGGGEGASRQQIRVVGSSTVYPFTVAVAERFAQAHPQFPSPIVESTGTGGGLNLFCAGVGAQHPDVANASRRIKPSELELCSQNGVNQVIELPVGIDGLALIESNLRPTGFELSPRDVYAALAANPFGQPQTAETWQDVNPELPDVPIRVYGPPPTSGTRDSFAELILEEGCTSDPQMEALKEADEDRYKTVCTQLREDGAFIEAGENDNLLMQRVAENQGSIGVLGYSFLEENRERVRGIPIEGVAPTPETIQSGDYPGSRRLYVYAKGEHIGVVPGLQQFLNEYAQAGQPGGYLSDRGLIPLPEEERRAAAEMAANPRPMTPEELQ